MKPWQTYLAICAGYALTEFFFLGGNTSRWADSAFFTGVGMAAFWYWHSPKAPEKQGEKA